MYSKVVGWWLTETMTSSSDKRRAGALLNLWFQVFITGVINKYNSPLTQTHTYYCSGEKRVKNIRKIRERRRTGQIPQQYNYTAERTDYASLWPWQSQVKWSQRACCCILWAQQLPVCRSCCASSGQETWGALWACVCSSLATGWCTAAADHTAVVPCLRVLRYNTWHDTTLGKCQEKEYKFCSCGFKSYMSASLQAMTHVAAAKSASLVFVCVHREHYEFLETLAPHLEGKVNIQSVTIRYIKYWVFAVSKSGSW